MRPRILYNSGHQRNDLPEKGPLIISKPGQFNFHKIMLSLSRRHRSTFIWTLAIAWTVMGSYFMMVSVFVQQIEKDTQQGQQPILQTTSDVRDSSMFQDSVQRIQEDDDDDDDMDLNNSRDGDRIASNEKPPTETDQSNHRTRRQSEEYPDDSPQVKVHHDYRDETVDNFCDAFFEHFQDLEPRLVLSLLNSDENFASLVKNLGSRMKRGLKLLLPLIETRGKASWLLFHHEISQYAVYNPYSPTVSRLLRDLATNEIKSIVNFDKGTQTKLLLTLSDGAIALLKPMRFPREQETFPDHFYFNDFERHIAEIAAFHLDRFFSIYNDFKWFENTTLEENIYVSPAGNTCFFTECDMYCDSNHPICGNPDQIEVSLQIFLPGEGKAKHEDEMHPWARSYSKRMLSPWQHDDDYCDQIRQDKPHSEGRRLLDLMDVAVFDFFMGNMDRHDIDLFLRFGADTSPILFDNGRGFGKSKEDTPSILAPLEQCCQIRLSTLAKLIKLYKGPENLSDLMRTSLEDDPLESVLTEPHLDALDRRLVAILTVVKECVDRVGDFDKVVFDDGH